MNRMQTYDTVLGAAHDTALCARAQARPENTHNVRHDTTTRVACAVCRRASHTEATVTAGIVLYCKCAVVTLRSLHPLAGGKARPLKAAVVACRHLGSAAAYSGWRPMT